MLCIFCGLRRLRKLRAWHHGLHPVLVIPAAVATPALLSRPQPKLSRLAQEAISRARLALAAKRNRQVAQARHGAGVIFSEGVLANLEGTAVQLLRLRELVLLQTKTRKNTTGEGEGRDSCNALESALDGLFYCTAVGATTKTRYCLLPWFCSESRKNILRHK